VYSASAVMRYVNASGANDFSNGLMLLNGGRVTIQVTGDCPNWEVWGERQ
jgi:hypothetical protein